MNEAQQMQLQHVNTVLTNVYDNIDAGNIGGAFYSYVVFECLKKYYANHPWAGNYDKDKILIHISVVIGELYLGNTYYYDGFNRTLDSYAETGKRAKYAILTK